MNNINKFIKQMDSVPSESRVKYCFTAVRKHFFRNKRYYVTVLSDKILIGEVWRLLGWYMAQQKFNNPKSKYVVPLDILNQVHFRLVFHNLQGFGICYKEGIKYFEAGNEELAHFKKAISCKISFTNLFDYYNVSEQIGRGSFSQVYKAYRLSDNQIFAIKYVNSKYKNDDKNLLLVQNEINILKQVQSQYVIKIYEVYRKDPGHYALLLEYIDGKCLSFYLDQIKKGFLTLKEDDIKKIMKQLLVAVNELHRLGIIHRDIKPQNIMLVDRDLVKLIDFGLSIQNQLQSNRCGTPGYMPPEIINMKKDNPTFWNAKGDIFSLGVVFYRLLAKGTSCFDGHNSDQITYSNKKCAIDYQAILAQKYSENAFNLLKSMLQLDPDKRITAKQCLQHPFFLENQSTIEYFPSDNTQTSNAKCFSQLERFGSLPKPKMNEVLGENYSSKELSMELVENKVKTFNPYQKKPKPSIKSRLQ